MSDKKVIESNEFRTFFVNAFGARFGDNDVALLLFADTANADGDEVRLCEARVLMTPRSAKVLSLMLTKIISEFEQDQGVIPLKAGKEEEIANAISTRITR